MEKALSWRWAFGSEPLIIVLLLFFAAMVKESPRSKETTFDGVEPAWPLLAWP